MGSSKFTIGISSPQIGAPSVEDGSGAQRPQPAPDAAPVSGIKILFLGVNPSDTTRLALDHEVREITQRLRATPHGGHFELVQEWAVRVGDLQAALLRHRPQIVHFSGHGRSDGSTPAGATDDTRHVRPLPAPAGEEHAGGEILAEDDTGKSVPIPAAALADLFRIVGGVRCVVLNACHSATQAEAIRQHVDAVVGMGRAIQDQAAIDFAWAFYQGLGFGEPVGKAFELGKNQIGLEGLGAAAVPKLLVRERSTTDETSSPAAPRGPTSTDAGARPDGAAESAPEKRGGAQPAWVGRSSSRRTVFALIAALIVGSVGVYLLRPSKISYRGILRHIETGRPLKDVGVLLIGTSCTTTTDDLGIFDFASCTDPGVPRIENPRMSILPSTRRPGSEGDWDCRDIRLNPLPQMTEIRLDPDGPRKCRRSGGGDPYVTSVVTAEAYVAPPPPPMPAPSASAR